jgi:hypothetical protein
MPACATVLSQIEALFYMDLVTSGCSLQFWQQQKSLCQGFTISALMQVPKHLNAAMVAEMEQEYGATREAREQYAKSLMYVAGAKGSAMVGFSGIAAHFLAEKYGKGGQLCTSPANHHGGVQPWHVFDGLNICSWVLS